MSNTYFVIYEYRECHRKGHKAIGIEEFSDRVEALKLREELLREHKDCRIVVIEGSILYQDH